MSSSTTTSGGLAQYLLDKGGDEMFDDAITDYRGTRGDPRKVVAGFDPSQEESLLAQEQTGRDMMAGTGIWDNRAQGAQALQRTAGGLLGQASAAGNLGSARSEAAMGKALLDKQDEYTQQSQGFRQAGAQMLGEAGTARRDLAQQDLDAPTTSRQRVLGLLGQGPQDSTTTKRGTHCCTAAQSEGHMTFTEVKKLRAWHRKQSMIWQEGYDVWGKVVAENWISGRSKWSSDRVRDFYNHRIYGKRTIGSVYADIVIVPLSYLIGIYKVLKKRFNFEKILSENAGVKE